MADSKLQSILRCKACPELAFYYKAASGLDSESKDR